MGFTVERYHDICAGHRVMGHEGKCRHLHGHNYRVYFTCTSVLKKTKCKDGWHTRYADETDACPTCDSTLRQVKGSTEAPALDRLGRVIDFSVIKSTLCEWLETKWDHRMLIWQMDNLLEELLVADPTGVVVVPFNPTAENMAQYLVDVVGPEVLPDSIVLVECRVEETRKCSAIYRKEGW